MQTSVPTEMVERVFMANNGHDTHSVMKCKICHAWPSVSDPKSPLVMGSDKFRKDPLYAHAKSTNHVACVTRNDCINIPIKDTPIGKAVVHSQKEQLHQKFKHLFNTMYAIAKICRPFRYKKFKFESPFHKIPILQHRQNSNLFSS